MIGKRIVKAAVLAVMFVFALAAQAGAATPAEGRVTLKLDRGLRSSLKSEGAKVRGVRPAVGRVAVINLPMEGGGVEISGKGRLVTAGGIEFAARGRRATLRDLVLDTAFGTLSARLGSRRLALASVTGLSRERNGFAIEVGMRRLTLTRAAAAAIDAKLGTTGLLRGGQRLASATAVSLIAHIPVIDGRVYLSFATGFAEKLRTIRVNVKPLGNAWLGGSQEAPMVAITHTVGRAALDLSEGPLSSESGFAFKQFESSAELALHDIVFDLGAKTARGGITTPFSLPAEAKITPFATFQLPVTYRNSHTGALSTPNSPVKVTGPFAARLNEVLAAPKNQPSLFVAGEPLGEVAFNLETRRSPGR
jgi:hypothetical protein